MCALLIAGVSECAICGRVLDDAPFLSTWGVPFEPGHPLYRFCDAGLHLRCLETWPDREAFALGHYEQYLALNVAAPGGVVATGEHWFLGAGPAKTGHPYHAHIVLRRWPIRLYSRWDVWTENMAGGFGAEYTGPAQREVETMLEEVRRLAPTTDDLHRLWLEGWARP